eukprot:868730-Amphidinium_carterae.1
MSKDYGTEFRWDCTLETYPFVSLCFRQSQQQIFQKGYSINWLRTLMLPAVMLSLKLRARCVQQCKNKQLDIEITI